MGAREDDTELDALAAHVRSHPPLSSAAADRLIAAAVDGDDGAREALVEHTLGAVLDEAVAHRDHGVELTDLFQEGSIAALVAVGEYVARRGSGAQLTAYVRRVVAGHLDRVIEREEAAAAEAAAMIRDTQLLEAAQVRLRSQFGRQPTGTELAALLDWTPQRVELVGGMLANARELFDAEIVQYLDDIDESEDGGG
jgi:DNA-directed RNA polymerase specialized sigma subunit